MGGKGGRKESENHSCMRVWWKRSPGESRDFLCFLWGFCLVSRCLEGLRDSLLSQPPGGKVGCRQEMLAAVHTSRRRPPAFTVHH